MSPDDRRFQVASLSNCGRISQLAPAASAEPRTLMMPCTWWSGSTSSAQSAAVHSHAVTSDAICAAMFPCVVTAPLGFPVVPLV